MSDETKSAEKLICNNCGKIFAQERYLRQHKNRKTKCTKKFICKKCDKQFPTPSKLRAHENRKTPCAPNEVPVIKGENSENRCHLCNNTYSSAYSLRRHQNGSCNTNKTMLSLMKTLEEKDARIALLEENKQLSDHIISSGLVPLNQTVNNNNVTINNVQQNLYVNVTICSFGDEDLSRLDNSTVMKLLKDNVGDFMPKMIEHVHANPEHPEFHNVFYDPIKEKAIVFAPISETEMSWQMRNFSEVSAHLTAKIKQHIRPGYGPYFDQAMQARDSETSNNIINIVESIDWSTDEVLDKNRNSLAKIAKNQGFLEQVELISTNDE
jgi:Zinc finger, C2H2 type